MQHVGRLVGVLVVFLCLHVFTARIVGGGCLRIWPGDCSLVVGVCGGLFVICIVVASIFVLYCFLCFV